jgi:hypothetical protein
MQRPDHRGHFCKSPVLRVREQKTGSVSYKELRSRHSELYTPTFFSFLSVAAPFVFFLSVTANFVGFLALLACCT